MPKLSFQSIRQRKLAQWTVAYLAIAWTALQAIDVVGNNFDWPGWISRAATMLLGAGFAAVLILAWYHGEKGHQKVTAVEGALLLVTLVLGATGAVRAARMHSTSVPPKAAADFEPNSVVVLPFANRSPDPDDEYFSDGISEEILNQLARIPNLHVRARTSSFAFKGRNLPMPEIARQLRVQYVLEGSVQRAADRVRIRAQLIDASTDQSVWTDQFERNTQDVFAVEDEISRAIAEKLRLRLTDSGASARTTNPEAHEQYLRGRYLLAKGSADSIVASWAYFERAIALDSGYAAAYGGLAEAYMLSTSRYNTREMFARARAAAVTSLRLDDRQGEVHAVLGALYLWHDWNLTESERELKRALQLNPNAANTYDYYAWMLQLRGRPDEAVRMVEEAARVDPFSGWISYALEFRYVNTRKYDRAIEQHRRTMALDPDQFYWDLPVGIAYREKKQYDNAVREYLAVQQRLGRPLHGLAITYARMGRVADAEKILAELQALARREWVPPEQIALIYANLGKPDEAMQWLEKSLSTRSGWLLGWSSVDPSYDPLRSDPRFQAMEKKIQASLR